MFYQIYNSFICQWQRQKVFMPRTENIVAYGNHNIVSDWFLFYILLFFSILLNFEHK